jgi:gluconate transporter
MAAALSVTHGFLPPHPGPVALAGIFHADIGKTLLYGLAIAIPVAIIAGIVFPGIVVGKKNQMGNPPPFEVKQEKLLPPAWKSFLVVLVPIIFITIGTVGVFLTDTNKFRPVFLFLQDPTMALLISLGVTLLILKRPMISSMEACVEGVKSIAMILLIIAAGGAFKQVLIDSNTGTLIKSYAEGLHLSPLFFGWLVAAIFRVTLGSATVAALTASGIVAPFLSSGVSPELMVLSVGAGSLMCSHVNDTGFWMFKEYFGLNLRQTFMTWTLMESIISVLGLAGVLIIDMFFM